MREIVLPTTPEEAWDVLVDWERQADWMLDADRVDVVSAHREGVGVRLAVKTRLFGVPAFTEPMEVTVWEPPRRLQIRHGSVVSGARASGSSTTSTAARASGGRRTSRSTCRWSASWPRARTGP